MTSKKSNSKIKIPAPSISSKKNLKKSSIIPRSQTPDLSVVNVIERISKLLRLEAREVERKKASGE